MLIEHLASLVIVVSSTSSSVGPSPTTFFILSTHINELLSTPKITTFLPSSSFGN